MTTGGLAKNSPVPAASMLTINLTGHEMVEPKPMSSDGWDLADKVYAERLDMVGFLMLLDDLALDLRSVA